MYETVESINYRSKITIDGKNYLVYLTRCNPKHWHDKYRCTLSEYQFYRIFYNPFVIMYNGLQYRLETFGETEPKLYVLEFARTPVYHDTGEFKGTYK